MLSRPAGFTKVDTVSWPTSTLWLEPGSVTVTRPSLPMLTDRAFSGIITAGSSG